MVGSVWSARKYARRGLQIWRAGGLQCPVEELSTPAVVCHVYEALSPWQFGEIDSCQATMVEAISLAKELNDTHALALALHFGAFVAQFERIPAQVERLASELIELSTRQNFPLWLATGEVLRGWSRSVFGDPAGGISRIEKGIEDYRAMGSMWTLPYFLALKAEALHFARRTSAALDAIVEAEALAERSEERWCCAELQRFRGIFLAATAGDQSEIEACFCAALRIAKEQKSISLAKRAEETYARYRAQKAKASGECKFRLSI